MEGEPRNDAIGTYLNPFFFHFKLNIFFHFLADAEDGVTNINACISLIRKKSSDSATSEKFANI